MNFLVSKIGVKPLIAVGVATALVNILYLSGSLFMLQVYDRVIPSKSLPTLWVLLVFVIFLFICQAVFDILRMRILTRSAWALDSEFSPSVYRTIMRKRLRGQAPNDAMSSLRELDTVCGFIASPGPAAFLDLPWVPFYLLICFAFHWIIGLLAIFGALVLIGLTFLTSRATTQPARLSTELGAARITTLNATLRSGEAAQAMGMVPQLYRRWTLENARFRHQSMMSSDVSVRYSVISKTFRIAFQSAILAVGALLVIGGEASSGIMIASSILISRTLAPIEQVIASWRAFVVTRDSLQRLKQGLEVEAPTDRLALGKPKSVLAIEGLTGGPPGADRLAFADVSFQLKAGEALGIIGPSGSGKTSLVRSIIGLWPKFRGVVRFDGAASEQWDGDLLGRHVGYLPQEIELLPGTVAANISRFEIDPPPAAILAAAQAAGVHDLILRLPKGYETEVGEGGGRLSAGQRQRIGLARALYGDPFLVVLDEPNANLDAEGERALTEAIQQVRSRGGVAIVIAHRPSAIEGVSLLMMMANGRVQDCGPKDEVTSRVIRAGPRAVVTDRGVLKIANDEPDYS